MTERDNILTRIREALRVSAPRPGSHVAGASNHAHEVAPFTSKPLSARLKPATDARQWLPKVGPSFDEQLALFAQNAANLKASFQLFSSLDELKAALLKLRDAENWQRLASHDSELTNLACDALALPVCRTGKGYDVKEMERCDTGVTGCDALIAQTGSVLVTSRSAGGRALSILPPHHVVIARREQLVADLPAAFALVHQKYAPDYPSMISFITGPSRTGDIERILVLGAHGPKKLTIFCV